MDQTCGSDITIRANEAGPITARPTIMERKFITIESTDDDIILAVPNTNITHSNDNSKLPKTPK